MDKNKDDFFNTPMFTVIALLPLVLVVVLALLSTIVPGFAALVSNNEVVLAVLMVFAFVVGPAVGVWMIVKMLPRRSWRGSKSENGLENNTQKGGRA